MCFNKKLKQQISSLQTTVDELATLIKTNELERLRYDSKILKEKTEDLRNISIKVRTATYVEDDSGKKYIRVVYNVPTLNIPVDENGKLFRNKYFIAINKLDLLPQEDTAKIQKAIDLAAKNAKNDNGVLTK